MRFVALSIAAAAGVVLGSTAPPGGVAMAAPVDRGLCAAVDLKIDPNHDGDGSDGDLNAALAATASCGAKAAENRASVLYRLGRADEALAAVGEALAVDPGSPLAQLITCQLLTDRKDYAPARIACDKAVAGKPGWGIAYSARGILNRRDGRPDQAIADFIQAVAVSPASPNVYALRGEVYEDQKKYDLALADFRTATTLRPSDPVNSNSAARVLVTLERPQEALAFADQSVAARPRSWNLLLRGQIQDGLGHYDLALADFNQAIALDPKEAQAYTGRAAIRLDRKDYAGALADDEAAMALGPKWSLPVYQHGNALLAKGDNAGAAADFKRATELAPAWPSPWVNLASASSGLGKYADAKAAAGKAVALDATQENGWTNLGFANYNLGDKAAALAAYDKAFALNPRIQPMLFWRARTYADLGRPTEAEADYTRLVAVNPRYAWAYLNRGELRMARGATAEALTDFETALPFLADQNRAWIDWGYALLRSKGDIRAALDSHTAAFAGRYDTRPFYWAARAEILATLSDVDAAQAALDRAKTAGAPAARLASISETIAVARKAAAFKGWDGAVFAANGVCRGDSGRSPLVFDGGAIWSLDGHDASTMKATGNTGVPMIITDIDGLRLTTVHAGVNESLDLFEEEFVWLKVDERTLRLDMARTRTGEGDDIDDPAIAWAPWTILPANVTFIRCS